MLLVFIFYKNIQSWVIAFFGLRQVVGPKLMSRKMQMIHCIYINIFIRMHAQYVCMYAHACMHVQYVCMYVM